MVNGAGNTLERAGNGLSNVVNDGKNALENMGGGVKNVVNDTSKDTTRDVAQDTKDGYTATRTGVAANGNTTTGTNNALIWTVLAITGLIIIALVWFYGTQKRNNRDNY